MEAKNNNQQTSSLQIFANPKIGARIRVTVERGETWFVAQDICDILNLKNSRKAIQSLDMDEKHDVTISYTPGGNQRVKAVNESGLYHLVFISRKPEARAFRHGSPAPCVPRFFCPLPSFLPEVPARVPVFSFHRKNTRGTGHTMALRLAHRQWLQVPSVPG